MRQLEKDIKKALSLINEGEQYIIFNDGKAIDTNLSEEHEISVDNKFDFSEYYEPTNLGKDNKDDKEQEISKYVHFSSTIFLNDDIDLKIIHIGDDEQYMDYTIVVKSRVKAKIKNIYFDIINKTNIRLDMLIYDNADVTIYNYMNFQDEIDLIVNAYCLINAKFNYNDLSLNSNTSHLKTNIFLLEERAKANLTNVMLNSSNTKQDFIYNIYHKTKNTESNMQNYGIVKNESIINCVNEGKIIKGASNSSLNQKTKGIILDLYSKISTMPILKIDEYDVMASHGASIGAIDEEDLFYLMSRGLTRNESERLIINGFVEPYFRGLEDKKVDVFFKESLKKHLE